ncbi:hypothetical protein BgAZ_209600 [Babesia gibsoni]|uniref:Uncharacterized protein n=1 Tax=Babesia gibsoni TaxID=33632 RepID=A0AAD8PF12_BABGI|nr:hypothetical protein BgAZ_209600 [Babesia gibsoni]
MEKVRLLVWSILFCLISPGAHAYHDGVTEYPLYSRSFTNSLLSGDYAGIAIDFDVDLSDYSDEYMLSVPYVDDALNHSQHVINTQPGFVITKIRAAGVLIWESYTHHAENITVDIFEEEKYLKWNVNFGDTFVEAKYFQRTGEGWKELFRGDYLSQMVDRLYQDTIDMNDSGAALHKRFVPVMKQWSFYYNNGFRPRFNHIFTKVIFGERVLWEYDPEDSIECLRVDRIRAKRTVLLVLHFLLNDGSIKRLFMHGEGSRSMSKKKSDSFWDQFETFPPIEHPGVSAGSQSFDQKEKKLVIVKNDYSQKRPLIRVVDDGGAPAVLKKDRHKKAVAFDECEDGLITLDLFNYMDNPNVVVTKMRDDEINGNRTTFVPTDGNLIGKIKDGSTMLMDCRNAFGYKAMLNHQNDIELLQVFSTTYDNQAIMKYFIKDSNGLWKECDINGFVSLRMGEMSRITLDVDDIESKESLLEMKKKTIGIGPLKFNYDKYTFTATPAFATLIDKITQGSNVLWEFSKRTRRYLVALKMWQHYEQRVMSVETLDSRNRRHEVVYTLNDNQWQIADEGRYVTTYKKGVAVDLSSIFFEGITINGIPYIATGSTLDMEPMEGYYITEVTQDGNALWKAEESNLNCSRVHYRQLQTFTMVSMEMYDDKGYKTSLCLVKGSQDAYIQVDSILASFITRRLDRNDDIQLFFSAKRLQERPLLNYIRVLTLINLPLGRPDEETTTVQYQDDQGAIVRRFGVQLPRDTLSFLKALLRQYL